MAAKQLIREASPGDAVKIRNLHLRSIRLLCCQDYIPEQNEEWAAFRPAIVYRAAMAEGETFFLCLRGNRLLGFGSLRDDIVCAVYVDPRHARKGIGSVLLRRIEREARRRGIKTLRLDASITAVPFYRQNGYTGSRRSLHELSSGMKIPCVRMSKHIWS